MGSQSFMDSGHEVFLGIWLISSAVTSGVNGLYADFVKHVSILFMNLSGHGFTNIYTGPKIKAKFQHIFWEQGSFILNYTETTLVYKAE